MSAPPDANRTGQDRCPRCGAPMYASDAAYTSCGAEHVLRERIDPKLAMAEHGEAMKQPPSSVDAPRPRWAIYPASS